MRAGALFLALVLPAPVVTVGVFINPDDSVTIAWTLPADPDVVGVTIIRERLDVFEPEQVFVLGLDTSFTDFSASVAGDYRYWVHTRNAFGDLSVGTFVEVFSAHVHDDDSSSTFFVCWAAAGPAGAAAPVALSAALLILLAARLRSGP